MNFAKLANLAMDCEFGKVIANLAIRLRIWQGGCEFGKVVCEVGKAANFASLRNFAKLAKFYVRSEVRNGLCRFG